VMTSGKQKIQFESFLKVTQMRVTELFHNVWKIVQLML
jgi:hypothetical protein